MCGLIGYVSTAGRLALEHGLATLRHRGPDAANQWHCELGGSKELALGHARLSILDLSEAANQPFASSCGRYHMVFNGEIYNHQSLRHRLEREGAEFRTRSDTEVLLAAYAHWGQDCLNALDGMFAFVIYDRLENRLFMARDQFGIKPFYFHWDQGKGLFAFASEIRALSRLTGQSLEPDTRLFSMFLMNGWLYEPNTGISGISKLGPGQSAHYDIASSTLSIRSYYDPLALPEVPSLAEALEEAVALQSCADVPVGIFFSGGLDSSVVATAYPHGISGLFIDYSGDPSDIGIDQQYARQIADKIGMPLQELQYAPEAQTADAILADFRLVAAGTEEPISDYTYIATRKLSALAVQSGFKVMMSGMGGDELFAGYPRMRLARYYSRLSFLRPFAGVISGALQRNAAFAKRAARLGGFIDEPDFFRAYTRLIGYFSPEEVGALLGISTEFAWYDQMAEMMRPVEHLSPLKQAMYLDRFGFLAHNLAVTDRASMAESLEVRVPLLTTKLAAWAFHQEDAALVDMKHAKKPLRNFAIGRLGQQLVDRPKQGFNPPLDEKIRLLGRTRIIDELRSGALAGHVNMDAVDQIVHRHFDGRANETYRLWQLLYFSYWLESLRS